MFDLTIEVNQICNLQCRYCYVTAKDGKEMSFIIAAKTIDYALTEARQFRDNILQINFIGGEPIISYELIVRIVDYVEVNKGITLVRYTVSTNGIYLKESNMEFFREYDFMIKVSLDGTRNSNDINRVDFSGRGTYDKVVGRISLLKKYEEETNNIIQLTNVVTGNNYFNFYDNIFHLTYELGFKYIDTGFDINELTKAEYERLSDQIDKVFDLYKNSILTEKAFNLSIIEKSYFSLSGPKSFFSCRGGIVGAYIKSNGNIYACPKAIESGIDFGNVVTGLDVDTLMSINSIEGIENKKCEACKFRDVCRNKKCVFSSLVANGNVNLPSKFGCWLAKKNYHIVLNNKKMFDNLFMRR